MTVDLEAVRQAPWTLHRQRTPESVLEVSFPACPLSGSMLDASAPCLDNVGNESHDRSPTASCKSADVIRQNSAHFLRAGLGVAVSVAWIDIRASLANAPPNRILWPLSHH